MTPTPHVTEIAAIIRYPANLRSGPGVDYEAVASTQPQDLLLIVAQASRDGFIWYLVEKGDETKGWVYSDSVEIVGDASLIPSVTMVPTLSLQD